MNLRRLPRVPCTRMLLLNVLFLVWVGVGLVVLSNAERLQRVVGLAPRSPGQAVYVPPTAWDRAISPVDDPANPLNYRQTAYDGCQPWQRSEVSIPDFGVARRDIEMSAPGPSDVATDPESPMFGDSDAHAEIRDTGAAEADRIRFGSSCCERPKPRALDWLMDHQNLEGFWSPDRFFEDSNRIGAYRSGIIEPWHEWGVSSDLGEAGCELRNTALALYGFVEAGYDHKEGDYRHTCRRALTWIRKHVRRDGSFDNARDLRDHALAVLALTNAYGLSGDEAVLKFARPTIDWLLSQRTACSGWGRDAFAPPDIVTSALAILALKNAGLAGIELELADVFDEVGLFFEGLAPDPDSTYTRYSDALSQAQDTELYGYRRGPLNEACWVLCMVTMGKCQVDDPRINCRAEAQVTEDNLPAWKRGRVDMQYWWLGSLALYHVGGTCWEQWQKALTDSLLNHQRGWHETDKARDCCCEHRLDEHGSWDPMGKYLWDADGGRVGSTTLASICLEVYYRYQRLKESGYQRLEESGD